MLVITAIVGNSFRNDRSLSSASATMNSPLPSRALLPKALSRPPITAVGSSPHRSSTSAIIDVVVVLPWAPATALAPLRRRPRTSAGRPSLGCVRGSWRGGRRRRQLRAGPPPPHATRHPSHPPHPRRRPATPRRASPPASTPAAPRPPYDTTV